jgi:hypothetical protein
MSNRKNSANQNNPQKRKNKRANEARSDLPYRRLPVRPSLEQLKHKANGVAARNPAR